MLPEGDEVLLAGSCCFQRAVPPDVLRRVHCTWSPGVSSWACCTPHPQPHAWLTFQDRSASHQLPTWCACTLCLLRMVMCMSLGMLPFDSRPAASAAFKYRSGSSTSCSSGVAIWACLRARAFAFVAFAFVCVRRGMLHASLPLPGGGSKAYCFTVHAASGGVRQAAASCRQLHGPACAAHACVVYPCMSACSDTRACGRMRMRMRVRISCCAPAPACAASSHLSHRQAAPAPAPPGPSTLPAARTRCRRPTRGRPPPRGTGRRCARGGRRAATRGGSRQWRAALQATAAPRRAAAGAATAAAAGAPPPGVLLASCAHPAGCCWEVIEGHRDAQRAARDGVRRDAAAAACRRWATRPERVRPHWPLARGIFLMLGWLYRALRCSTGGGLDLSVVRKARAAKPPRSRQLRVQS